MSITCFVTHSHADDVELANTTEQLRMSIAATTSLPHRPDGEAWENRDAATELINDGDRGFCGGVPSAMEPFVSAPRTSCAR